MRLVGEMDGQGTAAAQHSLPGFKRGCLKAALGRCW
jgi:hypothetical protein